MLEFSKAFKKSKVNKVKALFRYQSKSSTKKVNTDCLDFRKPFLKLITKVSHLRLRSKRLHNGRHRHGAHEKREGNIAVDGREWSPREERHQCVASSVHDAVVAERAPEELNA